MSYQCPHCAAALDLENLQPSEEGLLRCPECGGDLPDADSPPSAPEQPAAPHLSLWRSVNRRFLILGAAVLLVLGAIAFFIASREPGKEITIEKKETNKREYNEYFQKLIREGKTTESDLDAIARIESFGGTFIGITRDALPWNEAEAVAKKAAGIILDLSQLGRARRQLPGWLGNTYPDTIGKTTWILDGAEPLGIDSPDFGAVTTLDRPRRAFVFWPGTMPTGWEWMVEPRFDEALPFEGEVARVRVGEKWGLIDATGKEVHAPAFDFIGPFTEHGCAVVYQGESALIDLLRDSEPRTRPFGMPGPEMPAGVTCGLIDRSGKVLARPEWEDIQNHIHGFTPVRRDGKWGYLDANGQSVIPCEWDDAWRFSAEGFAVVTREGKRGMIDKAGKIIIQPEWDGALNFCKEGIGAVRREGGWALVDSTGKLLTEPIWHLQWEDRRFHLGFIPAISTVEKGRTLLGADGTQLVPMFEDYFPLRNGVVLTQTNGENIVYGERAKELNRFRGKVSRAGEGLLLVMDGSQFGFLDENGNWAVPLRNGRCRRFVGGLLAFSTGTKWGFMDTSGRTVVSEEWDEVRDFKEGFAAVRMGNLWGFVDASGKTIVPAQYKMAGDFSCGVAACTKDDGRSRRWDFVDGTGAVAFVDASSRLTSPPRVYNNRYYLSGRGWVDPQGRSVAYSGGDAQTEAGTVTSIERPGYYHDRHGVPGELRVLKNALGNTLMTGVKKGEDFKSGPVPHAIPAKYGLMDTQGNVLVEPKWEEVRILSPEWVWIGVGDKCGIANAKGNVVLEPVWDEVQAISPEWLWFRKGDKCGLADATGKVVVEPEVDVAEVVKVRSASIDEESGEIVLGPYGRPILTPWIRVRDQKRYRYLRPDGQPATPAGSDRADVLDFYGPKHVVLREAKDEQTSTWTLYEPSTNTRTPFPNAERLYWNWHMALSGFLWAKDTNDSKWKLMNAQGKDLGHAQDERPGGWEPRDGLGLLQDEKGWFFVNNNGDRVGGDGWTNARPFREGRAAVERDGKWGFIDTGGKVLVEPVWAETRDFKLGLAAVKSAGGLWGFVGTDGEIAVHPVWDRVQDFVRASGEPSAKVEEKTRRVALVYLRYDLACIDASGRLILEPDIFPKPGQEFIVHAGLFIQPDVYRVANRVAGWTVGGETDNISSKWNASLPIRWMLADTKGRLVNRVWSSQDRRYLWTYADDGSMVPQDETSRPSESNGYDQFDRMPFLGDVPLVQAGRWNEPFYDAKRTDPFSGGLITARSEEQKYALLRLDGTRVVPPVHDRIAWIAPGVAAVWSRDDGGLIGRDGNWLFRDNDRIRIARFGSRNAKTTAAQYRHGLVVIEDTPKWGYAELNR